MAENNTNTNNNEKEVTIEDVINAAKKRTGDEKTIKMDKEPKEGTAAYAIKKALENGESLIEYQKNTPELYRSALDIIKDAAYYIARSRDTSMHNDHGSIVLKEDGSILLGTESVNSFQMSTSGKTSIINAELSTKTNVNNLEADDIIINNHKLNNKLYELADFKKVLYTYDDTPKIAGGLTMLGTVLVRAWEPSLKRYVLVRRLINMPVFSPSLGGKEINPGIKVSSDLSKLSEWKKQINTSGIQNPAQLFEQLAPLRDAAIAAKEKAKAEENEKIKEENAKKKATSMTTITGQDPATVGGSVIANGTANSITPGTTANQMTPTTTPSASGWDSANNRPNDMEAYWYKVNCSAHKFYVMKGQSIVETWSCNYSSFGTSANKVAGDQKTPLGTFTISKVEKNNMSSDVLKSGCKLPGVSGVFGPYYMELSAGNGIAIHGDYPSEDAKGNSCLLRDAKFGTDAVEGEGSTHGCIRLSNANVTTLATKYVNMKTGQYIKIEA